MSIDVKQMVDAFRAQRAEELAAAHVLFEERVVNEASIRKQLFADTEALRAEAAQLLSFSPEWGKCSTVRGDHNKTYFWIYLNILIPRTGGTCNDSVQIAATLCNISKKTKFSVYHPQPSNNCVAMKCLLQPTTDLPNPTDLVVRLAEFVGTQIAERKAYELKMATIKANK